MRFLGPAADAASEVPTWDQIPDTGLYVPSWRRVLTADATAGTSLTTISGLTINSLAAGTYLLEADIIINGGANNSFWQINYSGTATNNQLRTSRFAGSAVANTFGMTLGVESASTGTTMPQSNYVSGYFVATTGGNLTVQVRRAASGTCDKGSWVKLSKVA